MGKLFLTKLRLYQSNFKMRVIFPRIAGKYNTSPRLADCNLKFIKYMRLNSKDRSMMKKIALQFLSSKTHGSF